MGTFSSASPWILREHSGRGGGENASASKLGIVLWNVVLWKWSFYSWGRRSCGYPHIILPVKIPAWGKGFLPWGPPLAEGLSWGPPLTENISWGPPLAEGLSWGPPLAEALLAIGCGWEWRIILFLLGPLAVCQNTSRRPNTYAHISNTNWTQLCSVFIKSTKS